jgi:hypothetical protein
MNPLYVFLHVPRTGGTTFDSLLNDNGQRLLRVHTGWPPEIKEPLGGFGSIDWLSGHIPYGWPEIKRAFPDRKPIYFTMLRFPIERTLSHYRFARKTVSFPEWIVKQRELGDRHWKGIDNGMTRQLGCPSRKTTPTREHIEIAKRRLAEDVLFGFTEEYDVSLQRFQVMFPGVFKSLHYERKNATEPMEIPGEWYEVAANVNELDLELYRFARSLYAKTTDRETTD